MLRAEGFGGSKQGAVEDSCWGRGMGGRDVVVGLVGVGMADIEAIVVHDVSRNE